MRTQTPKKSKRTRLFVVFGFVCLQFLSQPLFAAPGDVLFTDDFERTTLGASWAVNNSGGGDAGIGTYTANSGTRSLYTRWNIVYVTSGVFDLSAAAGAQLDIWVRRGDDAFSEDPEVPNTEDLVVEYLNNVGSWQELSRYVGGGTPGEIFTPTLSLPTDALHAGFRFRFRQAGGDGSNWDYWHVDDVALTETAGLPTLAFPFCDDFESGLTNWQVLSSGGNAGIGSQTANSASNSLYLRWGAVNVTSNDIDLSAASTVYLNVWIRRGDDSFSEDPDNNEDLTVEYYNNSGSWVSLETFNGNGTTGEIFNRSYALPVSALHSAFKVRFSMSGGSGSDFDYWHVDDVCLAGPPGAAALYHLDETSWGAVTDSSGNGKNGTVVGSVTPNSASPVNAADPGTCGYADIPFNNAVGTYDAIDTGIDVDSDIGNVGTIDFWYKSNARWNGNNGDRQLLDASTTASGQKYFFLTLQNNSRLHFGLEDSADGDYTFESGNNNFNAGVWVHVAVTWDLPNDVLQIYINGSLDSQQTFSTNGVLGNMDTLYLGDNRSTYIVGGMTGNSANGSIDEARVYDFVLTSAEVQADMNATHPCGSTLDHFVIQHAGVGINCVTEPVTVTAKLADGSDYTGYTGSIVLDTQSGNGSWTLNSGTALNFADATADDGLATYTFDPADNGVAIFDLSYQSGTPSIDVDAYDGATRDDDTEGNLVFSPSGFTVTSSVLTNPPPGVIDTSIPAQTAANDFQLYLAAYGQTPTDSTCGIIEAYTGAKNLRFWSSYNNPGTGTLPVKVNTIDAFASEAAADLGVTQPVTFTNGQAAITVNYADVGQISLAMKDDTVTADLPTGVRGASDLFVVKPAGFVLSAIQRTSDSFANPAAANESGTGFIAAGDTFSATVTAVNALGVTTPNYGNETNNESVALMSTLVAPGGGANPALAVPVWTAASSYQLNQVVQPSVANGHVYQVTAPGVSGGSEPVWPIAGGTVNDGAVTWIDVGNGPFGVFNNGSAVGNFHWDEVGIITLTPSVGDGDYLGAGNISGTVSANVGRFYPDHFITATTPGSFANTCATGTAFTYVGESFGYLGSPTTTVTAQSAVNTTTTNYTGVWAKLAVGGVSLNYPVADNTQLDENGVVAIGVTSSAGALSRVDNADGSLTFTLGGASVDSFAYVRDAGQVSPFTSDLTISLTAVNDGEASASDLGTPKAISPAGNQQRFGRGYAQDVYGTMSQVGNSLVMPIRSWFFNALGGWSLNTDDSCSKYTYVVTDTSVTTSATPVGTVALANGVGDLTLTLTGAGNPGGNSKVDTVWINPISGAPIGWLKYDYDGVDQPTPLGDGNLYDDNASATATFGIFRGDDRYLYWREAP